MHSILVQAPWLLHFFAPPDAAILLKLQSQASLASESNSQHESLNRESPEKDSIGKLGESNSNEDASLAKQVNDITENPNVLSENPPHETLKHIERGSHNDINVREQKPSVVLYENGFIEEDDNFESSKEIASAERIKSKQDGPKRKFVCSSKFTEPWVMQHEAILADLKEQKFLCIPTDSGTYQCSLCQAEFKKSASCNTHAEKAHSSKRFYCDCCGGQFNAAYLLRKHLGFSTPGTPRPTNVKLPASRDKPVKRVKKRRLFACHSSDPKPWITQSQAIFAELHAKNFRRIVTPNNKYVCSLCNMQFDTRFSCNRHASRAHSTVRFHCDSCDATFTNATSLRKHLQNDTNDVTGAGSRHNSETGDNSDMSEKPWVTQHRAILAELKESHFRLLITPEGRFRCSLCGCEYGTSTACNKHAMEIHSSRCFTCERCGSEFARAYNLQVHIEENQCRG